MMFSLRTRYFQFTEQWRKEGFATACRFAFYKCEEMVPTEKDLSALRPAPKPKVSGLQLLELGPENFAAECPEFSLRSRRDRAQTYLGRGYRMFALLRDGKMIGDLWYVTRDMGRIDGIHPHLQWFGIDLADKDVYLFDLQVDVDQRWGGVTNYFLSTVLHLMKGRGMKKAYGCFVAHNTSSVWMHRLIGYRELPRFIVRRIFLYESARAKG